jgi:hypothetical protein
MNKEKIYSLCEAVADITYIAACNGYRTHDSRGMITQFIAWAEDFEYMHRGIQWGINSPSDYIDSIYHFTIFKIKQWSDT